MPAGNDDPSDPLHLVEDAETGDRFVLFTTQRGVELQLRFDGDEPWATQKQMSDLFGLTQPTISSHLKRIFDSGEVPSQGNIDHINIAESAKPVMIYSLDVVLAVGYRSDSKLAIIFRRWASQILRRYLLNGFVIDKPRLMNPKRNDRIDDLLSEIEDIRASEANVWKRVLELVSKCSDYHAMSDEERGTFFATFQNTVHWAVTSSDAANIVMERSDASRDYAGLTNFDGILDGRLPRAEDMTVAKNYYGEDEIKRLRTITNLALDFLASQAEQGRLVTVEQYAHKLRELVRLDGRPLRPTNFSGDVTKAAADRKAKQELAVYKERIRLEREADGQRKLEAILFEARKTVTNRSAARPRRKKK